MGTIYLHYKEVSGAVEVNNVASDRRLAAELCAPEPAIPEV
jgi:hypothetical protein